MNYNLQKSLEYKFNFILNNQFNKTFFLQKQLKDSKSV